MNTPSSIHHPITLRFLIARSPYPTWIPNTNICSPHLVEEHRHVVNYVAADQRRTEAAGAAATALRVHNAPDGREAREYALPQRLLPGVGPPREDKYAELVLPDVHPQLCLGVAAYEQSCR